MPQDDARAVAAVRSSVVPDVAAEKKRQEKEKLAGEEKRSTEAILQCILAATDAATR